MSHFLLLVQDIPVERSHQPAVASKDLRTREQSAIIRRLAYYFLSMLLQATHLKRRSGKKLGTGPREQLQILHRALRNMDMI